MNSCVPVKYGTGNQSYPTVARCYLVKILVLRFTKGALQHHVRADPPGPYTIAQTGAT